MSRTPLIAANWKMYKTRQEAVKFLKAALPDLAAVEGVEVAICPPFTALETVGRLLAGTPVRLGAQNLHWERQGAFTGEISPLMLAELGCTYVIVGHSERRRWFGETDERVRRKVRAAFDAGLVPILCVGETLEERQAGQTESRVLEQVTEAVADLSSEEAGKLVLAYEPVWAIGTGHAATGEEANRVIGILRGYLERRFGEAARWIRIQYGGSVRASNAAEFLAQPEVDGALVGGASLDPAEFVGIVRAASSPRPGQGLL
ncbi:MAG: triose-phosphate isomerase [Armatimonadota bacterium]|nr:triose-phosphate isomerase [Armatimonadota bacterium]MDR7443462.1 triose-phosphate isomerase [Armatimonadota bacterium]MDR7569300.1 triose-phosphate isomerase [Armatimonadota bacterium]MDR7614960.1 triose-phosphate isomerase [Armatimonadota bacterium]